MPRWIYDIPGKSIDNYFSMESMRLVGEKTIGGWGCSMDIFRMMEDMTIDGHYYISSSQVRLRGVNHQSCTDMGCIAKAVNEG
ncbi:hypothetical protein BDD12DRAFT_829567 [Trichophaea hybrida]|nr:hypothetical protein BDD12DRAFT_829567 [Trichophaea hybrida]